MRRTLWLLALLALSAPASAAPSRLVVEDVRGDANGLNGQGFGLPLPEQPTSPASLDAADIVSLTFATEHRGTGAERRPVGLDVTLQMAGPLQRGMTYSVSATATGCGLLLLDFTNTSPYTQLVQCTAPDGEVTEVGGAVVDQAAGTVTWTLYGNALPKGAVLTEIAASTSVFVLGKYDELETERTFTYG